MCIREKHLFYKIYFPPFKIIIQWKVRFLWFFLNKISKGLTIHINFHSLLWSYLSRVPIFLVMTLYIFLCVYMLFCTDYEKHLWSIQLLLLTWYNVFFLSNLTFVASKTSKVERKRIIVSSQRSTKSLSQTFSLTVPIWWRAAESLPIFKKWLKHISSIFIWPSNSNTLYSNSIYLSFLYIKKPHTHLTLYQLYSYSLTASFSWKLTVAFFSILSTCFFKKKTLFLFFLCSSTRFPKINPWYM